MLNRLLLLLLCLGLGFAAQAREITDMAGRKVVVPERIERVFGSAPPLNVLLHVVAPETMIGLSFPVPVEAQAFFPARLQQLPVLGGVFGMGRQMNPESVLALRPDIALAWKSPFVDQEKIETTFARMGIPVVFVQLDTLADWPAALRFTGQLLGREQKTQQLAAHTEETLSRIGNRVAAIPEKRRPRVYYAEGPDGLATDCHRSFHTEAIELAGGYNVYRCEPKDHSGMEKVSIEQVLAFAPDIIIAQEPSFADALAKDPRWRGVKAVRNGRVHLVPRWPHNWIDRPPSIMRLLGVQWLNKLFFPAAAPLDLRAETRDFYRRFLGLDLSDGELDLLNGGRNGGRLETHR